LNRTPSGKRQPRKTTPRTRAKPDANPIPFHRPYIGSAEIKAVEAVIRSGWLTMGPKTEEFERAFAQYVHAEHAIAVNSCTAAMHLALLVAGVGKGDEVITTVNTFCATAEAIEYSGARPVLVDVEDDTLNLSPKAVAAKITERTRAIVPVDFAGHPCDYDAIRALAGRHKLHVLADAAHSLSAHYRGVPVGTLADSTSFSFYVTKPLATGEGGMVTTDSEEWAEALRVLRLHGMNRDAWKRYGNAMGWRYEVKVLGYKYNLTDVQAALGCAQLRRQERLRTRRSEIAALYRECFAGVEELQLPAERPEVRHAWHLFVIRARDRQGAGLRDRVIQALADRGIGASVHFIPLHYHPYYAARCRARPGAFPVAERAHEAAVSLPIYPGMRASEVRRVANTVKSALLHDA